MTLAEGGYRALFRSERPVFPNYPASDSFPETATGPRSGIVYVGDVTEQRGAMTLLDAAAVSGASGITYVGRCSDELRRRLIDRASDVGIEIDLLGWKPHQEAMAIAGAATVGVSPLHDVPNYRHSLPTKTLEYLALGTPVVASDLPGTSDVIGAMPGVLLVSPGDVDALSTALDSVDEHLATAALAGAADVRKRFCWPDDAVTGYYVSLVED